MGYTVVAAEELAFVERPYRPEDPLRAAAGLTDLLGLTATRATVWRYPPGGRGRRHRELAQEEVFAVLGGALTFRVGEPPERVAVPAGSFLRLDVGTPVQLRNEGTAEAMVLIWGAPPERGRAEILDDAD